MVLPFQSSYFKKTFIYKKTTYLHVRGGKITIFWVLKQNKKIVFLRFATLRVQILYGAM